MFSKQIILVLILFLGTKNIVAANHKIELVEINSQAFFEENFRPNPSFHLFKKKQKQNKKITAAILAFPLPFGIVGLHRIYLNCAPYVPVVYIATLGGAFGVLPFIDFCILLSSDDISKFNNSEKVFMWVE